MTRTLILSVLFLMVSKMTNGQEYNNDSEVYRVVAVSSADKNTESVSNEIRLYLPMKIYVPTAFSPNSDGLNDTFGAVGEGIEKYKLTVYNRWGEAIFHSQNPDVKWDGIHEGKRVPFGTYNYELLAYGKEFGQVHKTGSVTVIN